MTGLLDKLSALPQLQELLAALHSSAVTCCAAVTGLAPVHRAMFSAALAAETKRPLLLLCADEKDVQRQAADIRVLLGVEPVCLPERELQLRPAAYSRQWENARLSALYRMARGDAPVVVTTAAALVQRCLSREVLLAAAFSLEVGARYDVQDLCRRLTAAGYTRTDQVEGPGQFALRGGILDVFSPGEERPLRCEFFDDELDSLGEFETATQRRVLNRRQVCILPASELLPFAEETTAADAAGRMEDAARRLKKEHAAIRQRLLDDAELLRQGIAPPGADRYMAAVCPDKTTAFDYLAQDTILCAGEAGRVQETLRAFLFQTRQDVTAAVEAGLMAGAFGDLTLTEPELETVLSRFALCQLESLPTSRYLLPPRLLLDVSAKQLSGYGGSLDAAATDITHYLTAGFGVLVLCGGAVRCRNMQEFLQRRHIPAALALEGDAVPAPGQTLVSVGALSAGSEPAGDLEDGAGIMEARSASIDQCEEISRQLGLALEVEDLIEQAYVLEVSTPGFSRLFFSLDQMRPYAGDMVELRMVSAYAPENAPAARRAWRGVLREVTGSAVRLAPASVSAEGDICPEAMDEVLVPWDMVRRASRIHIFRQPQKQV